MLITKIEQQKNNSKRYSVFLDNDFSFGIDEVDLLFFKLSENTYLSQNQYDYIVNELLFKKAKDKALKFLSYKMRSEKEVFDKLISLEFPINTIEKVISFLKKYNYINDEVFVKSFIDYYFNKGYGQYKIKYLLKQKGIDEHMFNDYFLNDELFNQKAKALLLLNKKAKNITCIDFKQKKKLFDFLARRGFNFDVINSSLKEFLEDFYE